MSEGRRALKQRGIQHLGFQNCGIWGRDDVGQTTTPLNPGIPPVVVHTVYKFLRCDSDLTVTSDSESVHPSHHPWFSHRTVHIVYC